MVEKYLKKITEKTKGGEHLFRGQPDSDWTLESSAERRIAHSIDPESPPSEVNVPPKGVVTSQESLLEDARKLGFGRQNGRDLSDLELLTELQHFDAATVLLDFTENPLVALYFACRKEKQKEGKVFCLPRAGVATVLETLKIDKILKEEKMVEWKPIMQGSAERRIIKQSSVFVLNLDANEADLSNVSIASQDKDKVITELNDIYGISTDSLYIDLSGFASNRATSVLYSDGLVCFYQAEALSDQGKYDKAIAKYSESIKYDPDNYRAYNNRGRARFRTGEFKGALVDCDAAIKIKPELDILYSNRSRVNFELNDFEGAIADCDKVIEINPEDDIAYADRGRFNLHLEELFSALFDFGNSLELRPHIYSYSLKTSLLAWVDSKAPVKKGLQTIEQEIQKLLSLSKDNLHTTIGKLKRDLKMLREREGDYQVIIDTLEHCIRIITAEAGA